METTTEDNTLLYRFIHDHTGIILLVLFTLLAGYARYTMLSFQSDDMKVWLLPWYEEIKANGGLKALSQQVGDYNIPYQTIIALFTYTSIDPVIAYKSLSILFFPAFFALYSNLSARFNVSVTSSPKPNSTSPQLIDTFSSSCSLYRMP